MTTFNEKHFDYPDQLETLVLEELSKQGCDLSDYVWSKEDIKLLKDVVKATEKIIKDEEFNV